MRAELPEAALRPRLVDLVPDALTVTRAQLAIALLRPLPPLVLFAVAATNGWWPVAGLSVVLIFAADVVVIHDLFHRNLGLRPRTNDVLLTLYGWLLLNSGHALAASHRHHHRVYPGEGDPEAYVDGWPIWRVVCEGPIYRIRVWTWAIRHERESRARLLTEMTFWPGCWFVAVLFVGVHPWFVAYAAFAEVGTWAFPLISVTGVHDRTAPGPLQQSRTLRAPHLGRVMYGMQFHLEHHLYPRVPACRLSELAAALDSWLEANGAAVWGGACSGRLATEPATRAARGSEPVAALT